MPSTLRLLEQATFAVLFVYFVNKVVNSAQRFSQQEVGTAFEKYLVDSILYPSFTICAWRMRPAMMNASEPEEVPEKPELTSVLTSVTFTYMNKKGYKMTPCLIP